jgi:hypothetical protein
MTIGGCQLPDFVFGCVGVAAALAAWALLMGRVRR